MRIIVIITASIFGSLSRNLKKRTKGLPINAVTAAIAKYAITDCIVYKKYSKRAMPTNTPIALNMPCDMVFAVID